MSTHAGGQRKQAAGGGGARTAAAPKERVEALHERSARLQREGGLPREVTPKEAGKYGEHLHVEGPNRRGEEPFDPADPRADRMLDTYGERQLGAALARYTPAVVRDMAEHEGIATSGSKAQVISRMTAQMTEGRYSANFAKGEAKQPTESMHERAARWQAEHPEAPREVRPGNVHPIRTDLPYQRSDPFAPLSANLARIRTAYGDHQLGAALYNYSMEQLRQLAKDVGAQGGASRAALLSNIVSHVTTDAQGNVHYSANFGGGTKAGTRTAGGPRGAKSEGKAGPGPKPDIHAARYESRLAKMRAQLAALEAEYETYKRSKTKQP